MLFLKVLPVALSFQLSKLPYRLDLPLANLLFFLMGMPALDFKFFTIQATISVSSYPLSAKTYLCFFKYGLALFIRGIANLPSYIKPSVMTNAIGNFVTTSIKACILKPKPFLNPFHLPLPDSCFCEYVLTKDESIATFSPVIKSALTACFTKYWKNF